MPYFDRINYVQENLGAAQASINRDTYSNQYGLFLKDDEKSEIEVVFLCETHVPPDIVASRIASQSSSVSIHSNDPLTIAPEPTEPPATLSTAINREPYHVGGYCRAVLDTPDRVHSFFSGEQPPLVVIYLDQDNAFECIRVTRQCFEQLIQSCAIMTALKDSILHTGFRELELEVAPPCPKSKFLFYAQGVSSGLRGFEVVYGLRFIEWNGRSFDRPWSLRQCVIYNKTHLDGSPPLWFFCHLPQPLRGLMDKSIGAIRQGAAIESLDIHVSLLATIIVMWRPFFVWITDNVERYLVKVSMASVGREGSASLAKGNSMIELKQLENEVLDALLAIKAARNTSMYLKELADAMDNSGVRPKEHLDSQRSKLIDHILVAQNGQIDVLVEQATIILQKIRSTSTIITNFLNLSNGRSLEDLALQSRHESAEMTRLANTNNRDGKASKASSVIALVYLPITVVLSFFSTSFVDNSSGRLRVLGGWWLIFAIGVPLTVATLFAWTIWSLRARLHSGAIGGQNRTNVAGTLATPASGGSLTSSVSTVVKGDKCV